MQKSKLHQDLAIADMFCVPIESYHSYYGLARKLKEENLSITFLTGNKDNIPLRILKKLFGLEIALDIRNIIRRQTQFRIVARMNNLPS